jgi:hypothetical protein
MKPLHWIIVLFWVVVVAMIFKQCHDSNVHEDQVAAKAPQHFFFVQPPPSPGVTYATAPGATADVEQTGFVVRTDTPSAGSFTCDMTVKNLGGATATNVQAVIRPFRGARSGLHGGDDGIGQPRSGGSLSDNDPLAQLSSTVTFPDLPPGAESTQSVVFLSRPGAQPGQNPNPEIDFQTAKAPTHP